MDHEVLPKRLIFHTPRTPIREQATTYYNAQAHTSGSDGPYYNAPRTTASSGGKQIASSPISERRSPATRFGLLPEFSEPRTVAKGPVVLGLIKREHNVSSEEEDEENGLAITVDDYQISQPGPIDEHVYLRQLHQQRFIEAQLRRLSLSRQDAMWQVDMDAEHKLAQVAAEMRQKEAERLQEDARLQAQQQRERDQHILELQRSHEKAAASYRQELENVQRKAREEAERRAAEAAAAEEARRRAERQAQEATRQAQQAEEAKRRQEQAAAAAAVPPAAAVMAASAVPAAAKPGAPAAPGQPAAAAKVSSEKASAASRCMRISPGAAKHEREVSKRMAELQASMVHIVADDGAKKQRRDIEKKMTVHVQQISATLDQVAKKCGDVYSLIAGLSDPAWRLYAMLQFATKVLRQYELIMLNNKAAYPLALVLVKVSTQFPQLMQLMLGLMHAECVLTVPMAFVPNPAAGLSHVQWLRLMGFREVEDPEQPGTLVFESTDAFCRRVDGVLLLYGAIVQVDDPANPHGLECGWQYLVRLLNALPADRITARALISFLKAAGYALHLRYRGQFVKLLHCMYEEFLPELAGLQDPDVNPLRTLLDHYLTNAQYLKEPEGRSMPKIDLSSYFDRD